MSSEPASASGPARYRRRTRWPLAVVMVLLLVASIIVWANVLKPPPAEATGCNEPGVLMPDEDETTTDEDAASAVTGTTSDATGPDATDADPTAGTTTATTTEISTTLGEFTDPNVLTGIRPADPTGIPLRVLNASTVTGQAKTVTDEMRAAGFTSIRLQDNDPLYPAHDLRCYGEIRYGYAGLAEARTVLLVEPCAQLVRDDRLDNSVDLSLGRLYQVRPVADEVRAQLVEIRNASAPPAVIEGQTVSVRPLPEIPPLPDRSHCPD